MSLTTPSLIQNLTNALGQADATLQATKTTTVVSTSDYTQNAVAGNLKYARNVVQTDSATADGSDLDNDNTLIAAARAAEKTYATATDAALKAYCAMLDTYFLAESGTKLKATFTTLSVVFSANFRALWRRSQSEELVVRLGSILNTSGTWGSFTADQTIVLASPVQLRLVSYSGTAAITANIPLVRGSDGGTDLISVTIPTTSGVGSVYALKGATSAGTYTGVVSGSVSITGGAATDRLEVWSA